MKLLFFIVLLALSVSCNKDKDPEPSADSPTIMEYLAGTHSKDWVITQSLPLDSDPACRPSSEMLQDNTWTFFKDSTFIFDNGVITEQQGASCSDALNFKGRFGFLENNSRIWLRTTYIIDTSTPHDEPLDTFLIYRIDHTQIILISHAPSGMDTIFFAPKK